MFKSIKYLNWQNDQNVRKVIQRKQRKPSKSMLTKYISSQILKILLFMNATSLKLGISVLGYSLILVYIKEVLNSNSRKFRICKHMISKILQTINRPVSLESKQTILHFYNRKKNFFFFVLLRLKRTCDTTDTMVKHYVAFLKRSALFEVIHFQHRRQMFLFRKNLRATCFKNVFVNVRKCVGNFPSIICVYGSNNARVTHSMCDLTYLEMLHQFYNVNYK